MVEAITQQKLHVSVKYLFEKYIQNFLWDQQIILRGLQLRWTYFKSTELINKEISMKS